MTAWQLAKQFQDEHCVETFEDVLGRHLAGGVIVSSPQLFICAREIHWDEERGEPSLAEPLDPNCWFVELAAGIGRTNVLRDLLRALPHPQKWLAWCRRGEMRVRVFNWNKLSNKLGGY
jgi:hypothetical protein